VEPAGMDEHELNVFVDVALGGVLARSDAAPCASSPTGFMDWMVVHSDLIDEEEVLGPVVAHELFHAIQRTLDPALVEDNRDHLWFMEASAAYEEALVFPEWTEAVTDRSRAWSANPGVGLRTVDGSHEYASFVFLRAVEALHGTPDWHRGLWEGLPEDWDPIEEVLVGLDVDADGLMGEYFARGVLMDLPGPGDLVSPADDDRGITYGVRLGNSQPEGAAGTCDPEPDGACVLMVDFTTPRRGLTVRVSADADEGPSPWLVLGLIERPGGGPSLVVPRDSWDVSGAEQGVSLQFDGVEPIDVAWVVLVRRADGAPARWDIEARAGGPTLGVAQDRWQSGCSCAASMSAPGGTGALVPLFILVRRRR